MDPEKLASKASLFRLTLISKQDLSWFSMVRVDNMLTYIYNIVNSYQLQTELLFSQAEIERAGLFCAMLCFSFSA